LKTTFSNVQLNIKEIASAYRTAMRKLEEQHRTELTEALEKCRLEAKSQGRQEERDFVLAVVEEQRRAAQDDPPSATPTDIAFRKKIRSDYGNLSWPQRLTLAKIVIHPGNGEFSLLTWLSEDKGFGSPIPEKILKPLLSSSLVRTDGSGGIEVYPEKRELIVALLKQDHGIPLSLLA
jgi:hypothetical protein